ncbi:hypothetical protein FA13DRAFT_1707982 [Coprinellus micaceus]|uniref:AB hydrolase-1 domain-containing protein n=1 Tax=Coprinellus micaceus TaxID=71717 RepID=A0A4Y7TJT1_COPMI|nr:hypothetical protein FA13DRAFT_1707982 [Coprinellus micaceus]
MAPLKALSTLVSLIALGTQAVQAGLAQREANTVLHGKCIESVIPVSITANNSILKIDPPANQQVLTDFVVRWTSETSNVTQEVVQGTFVNKATYNIYTLLCIPTKQDAQKTVELAIHGIGFDHTYWNLGGSGSKYNYVEAALKAGHAILIYDRLGIGKSQKPNGIKEVQLPTEVEIAAQLVKHLKAGPQGQSWKRFVGVGHSFGSATLVNVARVYGNILDATVLTGFTSHDSALKAISTFTWTIASQDDPKRLGSLPPEYLVWNSIINNQQNFFTFPNYDPAVLQASEDNKWSATLGELLTQGTPPAPQYTNPVFVVTGDKDYIFCGGNCFQKVNGTDLLVGTKELFPSVKKFSTYSPAKTGHGVNAHLSAPQTYVQIQNWIADI